MRGLIAAWVLPAAAFIEFYARRYEYAGSPALPHGLLALLAFAVLFGPARLRPRSGAMRLAAIGVVCVAATLFAVQRPLQLVHVAIVFGVLAVALVALAPALRRAGPPRPARLLAAAALAALSFALLLYYAVLLVGLESWNEIVTRQILWAYARQAGDLVAAMPISPWIPWTAAAAVYAFLLIAHWAAMPGVARDLRALAHRAGAAPRAAGSRRARWAAMLLVPGASALLAYPVVDVVGDDKKPDPLVATFFGEPGRRGTPLMPFRSDATLEALERAAAARYAPPARVDARPLVLITVDALRADQMHVYGHPRRNTPFLSRLHREGRLARYDNVFSACTESLCGILAILNGRYWHELSTGRQRFGLPDVLKRLGYRTHYLLGGDHTNFYNLRSYYGENVDTYVDGTSAASYMNDDAELIGWLRDLDLAADAPRFVYMHLKSVHVLGRRHPRFDLWRGEPLPGAGAGEGCCTGVQRYANNYHHGIRQMDARVQEIFSILEAKGLLADAVVVISSDHGELLGEAGGRVGHGGPPVDAAVRVPLLVYDARGLDYAPRALASVIDIAPTLLARIGAPAPAHWSGIPLTRPATGRVVFTQSRSVFAAVGEFDGRLYKYYHYPEAGGARGRMVRLAAPGLEDEREAAAGRAGILGALRGALPSHVASLRTER